MIPDNVLNAVNEQLEPLIRELARYNESGSSLLIEFDVGSITFDFK